MFRLWRLLYGVLDVPLFYWTALRLLRVASVVTPDAPNRILDWVMQRFAYSGWPHGHNRGWINIHVSRAVVRLRHALTAPGPPQPRRALTSRPPRRLRIGVMGQFCRALGFPAALFEEFPRGSANLYVIDFLHLGVGADYAARPAAAYLPLDLEQTATYASEIRRGAACVNGFDLDLLVNTSYRMEAYHLLDAIDTVGAIANYCTGCDLLHHDKVDFQLHCQPQADYFFQGDRLFCATTRTLLKPVVLWLHPYYDRRGIPESGHAPWSDRQPLIVFHGSLYKLASAEFLTLIADLMSDDPSLEFAFMGRNDGDALQRIQDVFERRGLGSRIHYEGVFSSVRDAAGMLGDRGWLRMRELLGRARFAPDPWPVGGGSSRFEAYAAAVPSISPRLHTDPASWTRPQMIGSETTDLHVPMGTAVSREDYRALSRRCLYDERYATALIAQQLAVARRLSDGRLWWNSLTECYERWRRGGVEGPMPEANACAAAYAP